MKPTIVLPEPQKAYWLIDEALLINSQYRYDEEPMLKFCYQPEENIIIFVVRGMEHKHTLRMLGRKFDDFIRGIYFREKKLVYLRGHENIEWLRKTEKMLRGINLPEEVRVVWGQEWANKLEEELKGL